MASTTFYTINPFGSALNTARDIVDVTQVEDLESFAPLGLPIRITSGVAIQGKPKVLSTLLDAKRAGILALNQGYSNILMDPCLVTAGASPYPGVNTTTSTGYMPGNGAVNHLVLPGGSIIFQATTLSAAPQSCVMSWEVYRTEVAESYGSVSTPGLLNRFHIPLAASQLTCRANFGNGDVTLPHGIAVNIAAAQQGTSLTIRFDNATQTPIYLGSWAIVF